MPANVATLPWSPALEEWSPPPLLRATTTSTIHARMSSSVIVPRCGAALPPGELWSALPVTKDTPSEVFHDWSSRVCRDCFTVYEQDELW